MGQTSVPGIITFITNTGKLDLTLRNTANNLAIDCHLSGAELNIYGGGNLDKWWSCDQPDPHAFPKYSVSTSLQFNQVTRGIAINQTWYCSDEGPEHP